MKPKLSLAQLFVIVLLLALSPAPLALSQIPQGFNYQAVLRDDPTNNPIVSQGVQIRFTIQTAGSVAVYQETHATTTDEFGTISLVVGGGTPVGAYVFSSIDWSVPLSLKTEFEYPVSGTPDYDKLMGTTALKSVPYALAADGFTQPLEKLTVRGNTSSFEEPLFEVKNTTGNTVFAVYNEGVRIYVGDGEVKGPKGGFAIGGFGSEKDENSEKYLFVSDDSVRVYINDNAKSAKGGFAIGGYGTTKGMWFPRYLRVTSDSTRVMTTDPDQGFGVKSGSTGSYLRLTPDNYFIGHGSGKSITIGKYNSFLGYEAGKNTKSGAENIFIGYQSGLTNQVGKWNTFLGYKAGMTNTGSDNTFIGYMAGSAHESQGGNVYIGSKAGQNATNGQQNVLIGESVGAGITTGSYNVMLGFEAGKSNQDGERNVFLGYQAGWSNTIGRYNVFIGDGAGYSNIGTTGFPGNFNVFMGYSSGYFNKTGQDNVFIGKQSGWKNDSGDANVYIGMNAGASLTDASSNIFIGSQAGSQKTGGGSNILIGSNAGQQSLTAAGNIFIGNNAGITETGSGLLIIENVDQTYPLITGDFVNHKVAIYGTADPAGATLQINGSLRVGATGSTILKMIKVAVAADLPSIAAGTSYIQTFAVANSTINSSVIVSPASELNDGIVISYARVSTAGTVEVKFRNTTVGAINPDGMNYYITVIQ